MTGGSRAWLMLAVGSERQHGGNDGYDDDPDVHYSWDSTVPNARTVAIGDKIVLWDKKAVVGASVIEEIDTARDEKIIYKCRHCGLAGIKARKGKSPRFKCYKCSETFDEPVARIVQVDTYRSRHDANWVDLERCLDGATLRSLCDMPKSQLSMRPLRWEALCEALRDAGKKTEVASLSEGAVWADSLRSGHREARVRVRLGQAPFRDRLLATQGPLCAFTGPAPVQALEAAHLYSYAELGQHHEHGGLLLRRDIHRLFDRGDIAVNPVTLRIDVRADLHKFPSYGALDGQPLLIDLAAGHIRWLRKHWSQHRDRLN